MILGKSLDDAQKLVDLGVELSGKHGKPLVVGAGAEKLEDAVALTEYAVGKGVYAVLVTDPIYAASKFAQQFGSNPLAEDYMLQLADKYHRRVMDAIPEGSKTIYMPYIFPELTAGNPLGYPSPRVLRKLVEHAEKTGKLMDGGKLTHEDKAVALLYANGLPGLSFQAGFDHKAQSFLADPRLKFNGAIFGTGNLIPGFLGRHVRDCLELREMRIKDPAGVETFEKLMTVTKQQNQVNAMFGYMWDTPGAFIRLMHGILGIGKPTHVPDVPQERLEQLARGMVADAPALAEEMVKYNPEAPLARVMLDSRMERMRMGVQPPSVRQKPTQDPKIIRE